MLFNIWIVPIFNIWAVLVVYLMSLCLAMVLLGGLPQPFDSFVTAIKDKNLGPIFTTHHNP
jgi:hypothetical protein